MASRLSRAIKAAGAELFGRSGAIDAGGHGRGFPAGTTLPAPARAVHQRQRVAGQRAAWQVVNNPHAAAIVSAWTTNLVADGPSIRPQTQAAELRRDLVERWGAWWSECDAEGVSDLGGWLTRAVRCLVVSGEAVAHLEADPLTRALRLRLWQPEQLDATLHRELGGGARIVAGIELDAAGRRIAYHIKPTDDALFASPWTPQRIPAADVLHAFDPLFPGQMRGASWLSPVMTRLAQTEQLSDSLLARANASTVFAGFATRPTGMVDEDDPLAAGREGPDLRVEPGAVVFAPSGYSVEFTDPPESSDAVAFLRAITRDIAAGAGLPYELVSHDLSQVNYSSARLGLLEFRRRVVALQRNILVAQILAPAWRRFVVLEVLAGRLPPAAMTVGAEFVFPGWAPIDPAKETKADVEAVGAGFKSRFEVIAARGRDPEAVDAEIEADRRPAPEVPA